MEDLEKKVALLERRLAREKAARKEAEHLLEGRSRELFEANNALSSAYQDLDKLVQERTYELEIARDQALSANKAKSEFLSSMSHELRTPLNAIIGFAQLLLIEELDEIQKDSVEEIEKAGQHLLSLINEVLDLAKVESGNMTLSIEPVQLAAVLDECTTLAIPIAQRFNVTLDVESDTPHFLYADHTRLKQVLINLISNAIKYNNEKGEVVVTSEKLNDEFVRIYVRDTGPGIPEENIEGMFEPFNRLGAENSEIEGTGIGLMITTQFVEMMNGHIDVKSEVGVGSTFWVDIPFYEVEETEPGVEEKVLEESSKIETVEDSQEKYSILYIEDNPANMRLMEQVIAKQKHYQLLSAIEPKAGLELAKNKKPDLILLDINLPGMDGYEVLEHLKARDETRDIPVIAVTANAMKENIEQGQQAGFSDYVTKPIDINHLLETIRTQLQQNL